MNYTDQQIERTASTLGWVLVILLLCAAIVADCTNNQARGNTVIIVFKSLFREECETYIQRKDLANASYEKGLDGKWHVIDYDRRTLDIYCHATNAIVRSLDEVTQ